ncbi:MAG: phosphotransferase [Gammaproteobacteria bacterium]|nr:phosphotransferase [Gammaproteobacteria bacterium]
MNREVNELTVLECVQHNYQITGTLIRLSGENLNYLLTTEKGERYVVKIVDDDMPSEVVEMENEAIGFAESAGIGLHFPEIVQNIYGKIKTGIKLPFNGSNQLRICDYIEGTILYNIPDISDKLLQNLGKTVAQYNLAMQDFDHPAAHRNHRWSLVEAGNHRDKISLLEDTGKRALLQWAFEAWEQAENEFENVPWQFIHGDMNLENIVVEGDCVTGLIDFGDACFNPLICELAICLTYIMMKREDSLHAAGIVTRAYTEILPLSDTELSVLVPMICGRLASSIAIATERRSIDPDNPNWFGDLEAGWVLLEKLKSSV